MQSDLKQENESFTGLKISHAMDISKKIVALTFEEELIEHTILEIK